MDRPDALFDREHEWAALDRFMDTPSDTPQLGLVYGRRRQGKSFLLDQFAQACGAFYYQALEEERAPALERIGNALGRYARAPGWSGARFEDWAQALDAIIEQADGRLIVLDELPYLARTSPELPSMIQAAFDAARSKRGRSFRMILCGSALSFMSSVLVGQQALRGRVTLDMLMLPFDFRVMRAFWGLADIETAFLVSSVLGGSPGYRDLLHGRTPATPAKFGQWLAGGILDPSHALFREADYLLAEDPSLTDRALYQSVIGAIANGAATREGVAVAIGRKSTALEHPLAQLAGAAFIQRDDDLLRGNRPLLRIRDPLLRFHHAVVRQDLARFESRRTAQAWREAEGRFRSRVLGPHLESMARDWTANYASVETLGGSAGAVGFTKVEDRELKMSFELDVVVTADGGRVADRPRLLAIGEAKSGERPRTTADLDRLDRLRGKLAVRADVGRTKLLLFGRGGFEQRLADIAGSRPDVELIDLARLYEGD